jgi:hypothetical protein
MDSKASDTLESILSGRKRPDHPVKKWLIYQQNRHLQILLLRVSSAPFC